ncbi:MAG: Bug family tripartite tricarboxylate transporter substrate binding protein [Burkholderiales bacterium]
MRSVNSLTWVVGAALGLFLQSGYAQPYPAKPIRLVTQFAPGSSGDTTLRTIAPILSQDFGQPVVIDNRAGGGGVVAAELATRAAPDGYTILAATSATQIVRAFMVRGPSFDTLKDFTPITALYSAITLMVAHPSVPVSSMGELIEYAKRNPNKLSFGSSGIGTDHHMTGEQIRILTGAEIVHIPYKATAQALIDVVTGQLPLTFAITAAAAPFIKSGKIKVLGVVKNQRVALLPDVPSFGEAMPKFQQPPNWTGIFGPGGLPPPVLSRLNGAVVKSLQHPDAQARWIANGYEVIGNTAEEFATQIRQQTALVASIVKTAGIKPE